MEFFSGWFAAPDRIEWSWRHPVPPGDDAPAVAARLAAFAGSLGDAGPVDPDTVIRVTHSPLLRAVSLMFMGVDLGSPRTSPGSAWIFCPPARLRAVAFDPVA